MESKSTQDLIDAIDVFSHVDNSLDYLEDHCPETRLSSLLVLIRSELNKGIKILEGLSSN